MNTMKQILFPLLMSAALFGAAIYYTLTKEPQANAAVLSDPSLSMQRNCPAFARGTKAWLAGKPGIREGSTLTFMVMGKDAINPEPTPVFTQPIPIDDDVVIGGDPEAFRLAQEKLFGEVEQQCNTAKAGRQSPIYQMVRQTIAVLRGTDGNGHGHILLKSDLDDDAHAELSALLGQAARNPEVAVPAVLAGSLDNANVTIAICGTAELAPRKQAARTASFDTRLRIWKALFTHPELVSTQPYCGTK